MRHPGLLQFAREQGTPGDPVAAIRLRARHVTATAMDQGWAGPPWDVEVLASLRNIRVAETDVLSRGQDALWTAGQIIVNRRAPRTRRRFSIAHEIVHSLLAEHDEGTDLSAMETAEREYASGDLEYLCQVGAAELLMPHASYGARMGGRMPAIPSIIQLARDFEVSPEAATRRAVDLSPERSAMLRAKPWDGEPPKSRPGRSLGTAVRMGPKPDDLVVTAFHPSSGFSPIRVAIGEPLPRDFHAHRAYRLAESRPSKDHYRRNTAAWPAYPELGQIDMEAVPLPQHKKPIELLAVLRPVLGSDRVAAG